MLEALGCEVILAENGFAAVKATQERQIDLVLMDCHMPDLDGFEATRRIREEKGQMPIVALTADVQKETRRRCLAAGMDDYLSKPLAQHMLRDTLNKWLRISDSEPGAGGRVVAPTRNDDGLLDATAFARIQELQDPTGPPLLEQVIGLYLENAPRLMDAIGAALEDGDAALLNETAHRLKSSSATLGANTLSALGKQLEAAGRESRMEEARALLNEVRLVYPKTLQALKGHLARLSEEAEA